MEDRFVHFINRSALKGWMSIFTVKESKLVCFPELGHWPMVASPGKEAIQELIHLRVG